ncbi:MAG: hypothetical protein JWO97_681 [Acidobacteria bacterium]|nr:hypothetical protein [Acidobacteriota bacterium]
MPAAWFREHLGCPDCQLPLPADTCTCGFAIPVGTPLDLRPQHPRPRTFAHQIGTTAPSDLATCRIERPVVTYGGPRATRDSSELFSAIADRLKPGARLLDLGCGPRDQAKPAEHYGLAYVGVDYSSPDADLLADAHALPFVDRTFDVVLSYAVFEHLYDPYVAAREVERVLAKDGVFVAVVSQGEPFHESYFHHTSLGVLALLRSAGLNALQLWPSVDTLHSLAEMGRYPVVIRGLIAAIDKLDRAMPFLAPRKFLHGTPREKAIDELHRSGSICFVAVRTESR